MILTQDEIDRHKIGNLVENYLPLIKRKIVVDSNNDPEEAKEVLEELFG